MDFEKALRDAMAQLNDGEGLDSRFRGNDGEDAGMTGEGREWR